MEQLLDNLVAEFEHWRSIRKGKAKTPAYLKEKILEALKYYPKATIVNRLGVNHQFINRIHLPKPSLTAKPDISPQFVPLPLVNHSQTTVSITYKNTQLEFSGSTSELVNLVKLLEAEV